MSNLAPLRGACGEEAEQIIKIKKNDKLKKKKGKGCRDRKEILVWKYIKYSYSLLSFAFSIFFLCLLALAKLEAQLPEGADGELFYCI